MRPARIVWKAPTCQSTSAASLGSSLCHVHLSFFLMFHTPYVHWRFCTPQVCVQFNLVNEPWLKYTLATVADKGLKHSQLTSARLRSEVLLLETARCGARGGTPVVLACILCPVSKTASMCCVHAAVGYGSRACALCTVLG